MRFPPGKLPWTDSFSSLFTDWVTTLSYNSFFIIRIRVYWIWQWNPTMLLIFFLISTLSPSPSGANIMNNYELGPCQRKISLRIVVWSHSKIPYNDLPMHWGPGCFQSIMLVEMETLLISNITSSAIHSSCLHALGSPAETGMGLPPPSWDCCSYLVSGGKPLCSSKAVQSRGLPFLSPANTYSGVQIPWEFKNCCRIGLTKIYLPTYVDEKSCNIVPTVSMLKITLGVEGGWQYFI